MKPLAAGTGLGAAALAVVLASAGCSPSPGHSAGQRSSAAMATQETTSAVRHWGSFFGGVKGNFDTEKAPVTMTLPGAVAEVGTSNSTEYALLSNGSLYAWGLGTQAQLGDGLRVNSFTRPVRVRFPAGVKIASIPADVMPYDSGLAVDTHGDAWGWGDNGGGELCLGNTTEYATPVRLPFTGVTALAGASNHALYDAHGTVYACGQNVNGDLGDGTRYNSTTPRRVARLAGPSPPWWPRSRTPGPCCPTAGTSTGASTAAASSATGVCTTPPTSRCMCASGIRSPWSRRAALSGITARRW